MNLRKAAVVGGLSGPWVPAAALKDLGLEVVGPENTLVRTELRGASGSTMIETLGPGVHPLKDADWAQSTVCAGVGVMCFLVSGVAQCK